MEIRLNIDNARFTSKPEGATIAAIRNRLGAADKIRSVTLSDLAGYIEDGRTFTPAEMTGTTGDSWKSQQLICADIDNKRPDKTPLENPLLPEEALAAMAAKEIAPALMYHSFSSAESWPRYRVVIALSEPLADAADAEALTARLAQLFNEARPGCVDMGVADRARIFFGGRPGCVFYRGGAITEAQHLRDRLPAAPVEAAKSKKTPSGERVRRGITEGTKLAALEDRLQEDKDSFDLADYVTRTEGVRKVGKHYNPCPICGHNDCLQITGAVYRCFSDADRSRGSIIDYLMNRHGISLPEALDKFKFEVMGYNRDEWTEAYKEQAGIDEGGAAHDAAQDPAAQEAPQEEPKSAVDLFLEEVQTRRYEPVPTGITDIDNAIGGGFIRQQLVLLGAAPGVGKTALAQWIFEGMAKRGAADVCFLNLEMAREQLLARSIARIARTDGARIKPTTILQGYKWTDEERAAILAAAAEYKATIEPHLIYNPDGVTSALLGESKERKVIGIMPYLERVAGRFERAGKAAPIVCIDYLQVIQGEKGADAAETIKAAVVMLKDYAIRHNTVVFLIMAHNRAANMSGTATMESGRDTSALEYSADLQLSLTYTLCHDGDAIGEGPIKNQRKAKKPSELTPEEKKQVTLSIQKGRFGGAGRQVDLIFDGETMTYTQTAQGFTTISNGMSMINKNVPEWVGRKYGK